MRGNCKKLGKVSKASGYHSSWCPFVFGDKDAPLPGDREVTFHRRVLGSVSGKKGWGKKSQSDLASPI